MIQRTFKLLSNAEVFKLDYHVLTKMNLLLQFCSKCKKKKHLVSLKN